MEELTDQKIKELEDKANEARILLIQTLQEAGSGHTAGTLGMADIFTAFYFHILNHNPQEPNWEDRDRLILSNGHVCPIRYVTMAQAGYLPIDELKTLRKLDSRLQGHPHRTSLPGLETTSGPLGSGLSQAIGIALSAKLDKKNYHVYCLASDGEQQEGNTWEAVMAAAKFKLDNITLIIDRNKIQIGGDTEKVMPLEVLRLKYESFNWNVLEIDGNNIRGFIDSIISAKEIKGKPTCIIAHTVPGKGVGFMENDYTWHGRTPNAEEAEKALEDLNSIN